MGTGFFNGNGSTYTQIDPAEVKRFRDEAKASADASQRAASEAATSASNLLREFRGTYYGALPSDPTVDPNGDPCGVGDLYFNSTLGQLRVFDGGGWQIYNLPSGSDTYVRFDRAANYSDAQKVQALSNLGVSGLPLGKFYKTNWNSPAFTKTGSGELRTTSTIMLEVGGKLYSIPVNTPIQMPPLTGGADIAIYACDDQTLKADASFSSPTGYSGAYRRIGGFHYAPGGNATARAGGDATPQINPYSLWDIKFRPQCADPRGMTLVAGSFWADIYLTGVDHHLNGTSKYNVTIADGSSPPKIPASFGGNGSTTYSTFNWWEAEEVMQDHGKDLMSYGEFAAAAFGSTELSASGTDPGSTILRPAHTSKWGVMLATGNMWVWSRDFSYRTGANAEGWKGVVTGRGSLYLMNDIGLVAAMLGGSWSETAANCGSRASHWVNYPWNSVGNIGARGRCDHLCAL